MYFSRCIAGKKFASFLTVALLLCASSAGQAGAFYFGAGIEEQTIAGSNNVVPVWWNSNCPAVKTQEEIDALNAIAACFKYGFDTNVCREDKKRVCKDLQQIRDHCSATAGFTGKLKHHYCSAGCTWDSQTRC